MMSKNLKEYRGVWFRCVYSHPSAYAKTATPCRALITPCDPVTGCCLKKRQLYDDSDSDELVNCPAYGKDRKDIDAHAFFEVADRLIALMEQKGMLPERDAAEKHDLSELAREFKATFFRLHSAKWERQTVVKYQGQYDKLTDELKNYRAESLTQDAYVLLQEQICRNASRASRMTKEWKPGDEPPSSARARLYLLYLLIGDLVSEEGYGIPVEPIRYAGKPSHTKELLVRTDNARDLPDDCLRRLCADDSLPAQVKILADTGLRIGENAGLLHCSFGHVEGSQGRMYYVQVTGKLDATDRKRVEYPKTDLSHRTIPLSRELGEVLEQRQTELRSKYGDVSLMLMCGREDAKGYHANSEEAMAYLNQVEDCIPAILRRPDVMEQLKTARAYRFDEVCQDEFLQSKLTCHALRRAYCTWLYCHSGAEIDEIYAQMGHADKSKPRKSGARGMAKADIYRMCLQKHVSRTLFHKAHPLRYHSDAISETEVLACAIELTLPPGAELELIIDDTEPQNHVRLFGEGIMCELQRCDPLPKKENGYALLADDEVSRIRGKRKLLGGK